MYQKLYFFLLGVCLALPAAGFAQNDSTQQQMDELLELSLEELMDVKIYSATKTEETNLEVPLSASTLTRREMEEAGVSNLMEALRLIPGVIVREQTPGNYDVHLRGLDALPPNQNLVYTANSTTLVMIDGRVVYNYFNGSTFWETLPVSLADLEQIEVVRGPAAALYGPNAVTGVINLITRKAEAEGIHAQVDVVGGSPSAQIVRGRVQFNPNEKISLWASGNYRKRERFTTEYFYRASGEESFVDGPSSLLSPFTGAPYDNLLERYPDSTLATERYAAQAGVAFRPSEKTDIQLHGGLQDSRVQKAFIDPVRTALTTSDSRTQWVALSAAHGDLQLQADYQGGTQAPALGLNGWQYDFQNIDVHAEYTFRFSKKFTLRPGLSYRNQSYNDEKALEETGLAFLGGKEATLYAFGASLFADFRPAPQWRAIAALRLDRYNFPDIFLPSAQAAITFSPAPQHLLRLSGGQAYRGSFIVDIFTDYGFQIGPSRTRFLGNEDLSPLLLRNIELGYRFRPRKNVQAGIEAFFNYETQYSSAVFQPGEFADAQGEYDLIQYQSLALNAQQVGLTANANWQAHKKFRLSGHLTLQRTTLNDLLPVTARPDSLISGVLHEGTPSLFGGFSFTYLPHKNLTINLMGYGMGAQRHYVASNFVEGEGLRTPAFFPVNLTVNYRPKPWIEAYITGRNLLAGQNGAREFAYTERIGTFVGVGLRLRTGEF